MSVFSVNNMKNQFTNRKDCIEYAGQLPRNTHITFSWRPVSNYSFNNTGFRNPFTQWWLNRENLQWVSTSQHWINRLTLEWKQIERFGLCWLTSSTNMHSARSSMAYFIFAETRLRVILGEILNLVIRKHLILKRIKFRILWILIPISLFAFGGYLVFELLSSFQEVPSLITIDQPIPTQSVIFPAITCCHPQTVLDYKARKFVQKM